MTLLALLIGLLVGVFSGIVGLGGGILMVPALIYFFHMSQRRAQGTSLAAMLAPVGILAFLEYYRHGDADLKTGLLLAAGFTIGAYFGGMSAQHIPELLLRRIFATTLIVVGIRMLFVKIG